MNDEPLAFLTPEWCDALVAACVAAEPVLEDVVVEVQLTGAPRGRGRISLVVDGGRLVACAPTPEPTAVLKLKSSLADATAMLQGELDPNVAFMRGDLKTDGPTGPLIALLAAYRRPDAEQARADLAARTGPA